MRNREGKGKIDAHNHGAVVAPDDRGAILERIGNEFGKLRSSGLTVGRYGHFATKVDGRVRQNHGNGLVDDAKCCGVRRMRVHDAVNILAAAQNEGVYGRLNGGPFFSLDYGAILIYRSEEHTS